MHRKFWRLLILWCLTGALAATEVPSERVTQLAEKAAAATVGVYSRIGESDRYYGSGVVIAADGYILTSTTAVPPAATSVEVYFADHSRAPAVIVEAHAEVESTLLKVARTNLPFLPLCRETPRVGEPAYTTGNANNMLKLGDGASFSAGVLSSIYEIDNADAQSGYAGQVLETDCAVNPGQDGGPLLDACGRVTGIISRGFSLQRWQGVAVPLTVILPHFKSFASSKDKEEGAVNVDFSPLFPEPPDRRWQELAAKFRPALVGLLIARQYPPERLIRKNWADYRTANPAWAAMDTTERRRATADFFAADSVLAANQMIRRPEGAASGVLVSPAGHIVTSLFNVQDSDRVFVDADQKRLPPPSAGDLATLLAAGVTAEFTLNNPVLHLTAVLHDGRQTPAVVVSRHPESGMALLKINLTDNISYIDLAVAGNARDGDEVALLGAAPASLNVGIVSAASRHGGVFFQFDALLNYANSGGMIISRKGRFLGIAGAPLFPQPVSGRLLPFTPPVLNQPALTDFSHCPNSGVGLAAHARTLTAFVPAAN